MSQIWWHISETRSGPQYIIYRLDHVHIPQRTKSLAKLSEVWWWIKLFKNVAFHMVIIRRKLWCNWKRKSCAWCSHWNWGSREYLNSNIDIMKQTAFSKSSLIENTCVLSIILNTKRFIATKSFPDHKRFLWFIVDSRFYIRVFRLLDELLPLQLRTLIWPIYDRKSKKF